MIVAAFACLASLSTVFPALAQGCEAYAEQAGQREGIPPGLMTAIARVESGRAQQGSVRAWPWTLNQGGDGSYHDSRADAAVVLRDLLEQGVTNVDIGCMQLNWYWHGQAFTSADSMLDPRRNTAYAAKFLATLYAETGDWALAVARYHSRDPERGAAYAARVAATPTEVASGTGARILPMVAATPVGHRQGLLLLPSAPLVDKGP